MWISQLFTLPRVVDCKFYCLSAALEQCGFVLVSCVQFNSWLSSFAWLNLPFSLSRPCTAQCHLMLTGLGLLVPLREGCSTCTSGQV